MSSYLSIDLDYWFYHSCPKSTNGLKRILHKVLDVTDKLLVDEHHNLLDHINSSKCDKIIHVDYHQDLVFNIGDTTKVECGNFFSFVNNKENIDFDWYYPDYDECIRKGLGFCVDPSYKPLAKKNFIYKNQTRKCGLPTNKELENVTSVGIAFSFDYLAVYNRINEFTEIIDWLCEMFSVKRVETLFQEYRYMCDWEEGKKIMSDYFIDNNLY